MQLGLEFNFIVDINGNFHMAIPLARSSKDSIGQTYGLGYTESYLCTLATCPEAPSLSEVTQAIDGFCGSGGAMFITGISIAPLCVSPTSLLHPSAVTTYYLGLEMGYSAGATVTIPLSPWLTP
jgi:hypothetical protein